MNATKPEAQTYEGREYCVTAERITARYGNRILFRDVSFTLQLGDSLCVTGPNGSGKSTMLLILARLRPPTSGRVTHSFQGYDIPPLPWTGYTGPLVCPYPELTVFENLSFIHRGPKDSLDHNLAAFGLAEYRDMPARRLSSGMLQRLRLAAAFTNDPPALILDEPGTNLDESGRAALAVRLEQIRDSRLIVIATNDPAEEQLCRKVIRLGC